MFKRNSVLDVMKHIKNKGLKVSTIIDVGVAYGTNGLYGVFDSVSYLMIEPLEEYQEVLKSIAKNILLFIQLLQLVVKKETLLLMYILI